MTHRADRVRPPAVAGRFYPSDPTVLEADVRRYVSEAGPFEGPPPAALVSPHAGYVFSGPVAGSAYATVVALRDRIERVVLLGPAHTAPLRGLAVPESSAFATPLGELRVDVEAVQAVLQLPQVEVLERAHVREHALEVQLPFIQVVLGGPKLVPMVVGAADAEEVDEVLERLWTDRATLVIVSSDLSHYLAYDEARDRDERTAAAVESLYPAGITTDDACGAASLRGFLTLARRRGLTGRTLDLRSSGDTEGPLDRVVGYGAFAFFESAA